MSDKQIIINDIDVSGCNELVNECDCYLTQEHHYYSETYTYKKCSDNPNCYYKQLARKEQECERLKNERTADLVKQLDQLKAEINRLQKTQFCVAYEKDCHKMCKQQNCIIKNGYKAEQKVEKIRQICNCSKGEMNCKQCPICDECEELCVNDENLQDIILQIIDEVE